MTQILDASQISQFFISSLMLQQKNTILTYIKFKHELPLNVFSLIVQVLLFISVFVHEDIFVVDMALKHKKINNTNIINKL